MHIGPTGGPALAIGLEAAAERLRTALALFATGEDMMRQNLRRRHPAASADEIERRLDAWLAERPGAQDGDAFGRPSAGSAR